MPYDPPYHIDLPDPGSPRASGEDEVTKFTEVARFLDDFTEEDGVVGSMLEHIFSTDGAHSYPPAADIILTGNPALTDDRTSPDGTVTNAQLQDDVVDARVLGNDAVTGSNIVDRSVQGINLVANTVTGTELAPNAVQTVHIGAGQIGNTQIAGNVNGSKLLANTVDLDRLLVPNPEDLGNGEMFLGADGYWKIPPYPFEGGEGGPVRGRLGQILVASSTASYRIRATADYECDGSADQETINIALNHANSQVGTGGVEPITGTVELSDGLFFADGPTLIPSRGCTFKGQGSGTILGATTQSGTKWNQGYSDTPGRKALIKMATTGSAQDWPNRVTIKNMHLIPGGVPNPLSFSQVSGIWLEIAPSQSGTGVTVGGRLARYGLPISIQESDGQFLIQDVSMYGVHYGVYVRAFDPHSSGTTDDDEESASLRGTALDRVHVQYMYQTGTMPNQAGIWIQTSDCHITDCSAGSSASGAPTGFYINSGNSFLSRSKGWYCQGWGFDIVSSRINISSLEAQDNMYGFRGTGGQANWHGIRVDNQRANMSVGMDISNIAGGFNISGVDIHQRSATASWTDAALKIPATGQGILNNVLVDTNVGLFPGRVVQRSGVEATALGSGTYGRIDKRTTAGMVAPLVNLPLT